MAPGDKDKSLPGPPLVPIEVQPALMMKWLQAAQRVPETRHPQPQVHLGETWQTLNWTQPLETASLAWILMRYASRLLGRYIEKRVRASCELSKVSNWVEAQMNRIRDICQDVWGHDHKIVRNEQKLCSSQWLHFFWNEKNSNKDWPAAPYSWSYWLQNLHQGVWGRGLRPGKGPSPVLETVPYLLLQTLWEGDNLGYGESPRTTLEWCLPVSKCISRHWPEVNLPVVFYIQREYWDYYNPFKWGAL